MGKRLRKKELLSEIERERNALVDTLALVNVTTELTANAWNLDGNEQVNALKEHPPTLASRSGCGRRLSSIR